MKLISEVQVVLYFVVYQFRLMFPFWIAGVITGSLLSVYGSSKIAAAVSGMRKERFSITSACFAALLGAASPICMYGTIPLIASLGRKGVHQYLLAAFMVSSVLINPNLFVFSFALGAPIALIRLIVCIMAGVAAGALVSRFYKGNQLFDFQGFEGKKKCHNSSSSLKLYLSDLHRGIIKTAPYFMVGLLLTALFERYFPRDILDMIFGKSRYFSVLIAATLGVPVYVCGGGTIPLLKYWMTNGMSPGAAVAFMVTGAATKLTNLSAVKIVLGLRNFVLYILFNVVFAVASGWIIDFIYLLR